MNKHTGNGSYLDLPSFSPEDALEAVSLANEYLAKEHCEKGMFVTLFFVLLIHSPAGCFMPMVVMNRLGNLINKGSYGSAETFLETIKTDLFAFT